MSVSSDTRVSAREKVGRWFDRNGTRLGWLVTGLLVGLLLGWWAGGYLSCSQSTSGCEVRATSIGAAGTWFGAIGTVAAVLTAVAAFRSDERAKREEARLALLSDEAREKTFADEANCVQIKCQANHTQGGRPLGYIVMVTNASDQTSIFRFQGSDFTGPLTSVHELGAGRVVRTERRAGRWSLPAGVKVDDLRAFEQWCERSVTIMFKMNGRYWRKKGHADAELIEPWDADGLDAQS